MKIIDKMYDVEFWAHRGQLIAVQWKTTAISIGAGMLPKFMSGGIRFDFMTPVKETEGGDWCLKGYKFSLLPGLKGPVMQWPTWYRWLWQRVSWRNYDACRILKSAKNSGE